MLYTQFNKLLVVGGDLAASSNCCCQDSVEGCEYLPDEFVITLSGMPAYGNWWWYTDSTLGPVADPHGRYVCPEFFNAWDGKTYRRYSSINCELANGSWVIVGEQAPFGWQWVNRDLPSKEYEHYLTSPLEIREYDYTLGFWLTIEDCVIGPETFTITAFISGTSSDPYRTQVFAKWVTEITLDAGETLRDKLPLTLDPTPYPWASAQPSSGLTAADYGEEDCSGFVPYIPGTNYIAHPGCVLSAA